MCAYLQGGEETTRRDRDEKDVNHARKNNSEDWTLAMDAARRDLKGLPLGISGSALPAFDDGGKMYYRGFRPEDLQKIAVAVLGRFFHP